MRGLILASAALFAASNAGAQIVTTPNLPAVTTPATSDFITLVQPCTTSGTGYCSRKATLAQVGSLFPSGTGGITQLTGDVTTASGTGSQAATISPGAVTGAKLYTTAVRDSLGYTPVNPSSLGSLATQSSVLASQLPALTGDVTSAAGSSVTALATVQSSPGTYGTGTTVPVVTVDAKGRITSISTTPITGGGGSSPTTDASALTTGTLNAARLPGQSGDVTAPSGSNVATLATVNSAPGTFGDASHSSGCTVNGKGLTTTCTPVLITPSAIAAAPANLANTLVNDTVAQSGNPPRASVSSAHLAVVNDTMTPTSQYGFVQDWAFYNSINAGHSGQRNAIFAAMNINGATADTTGAGQHNYVSFTPLAQLNNPLNPGAAGSANAIGQIYAMNPVVTLPASASPNGEYAAVVSGMEVDLFTSAPSQAREGVFVSGGAGKIAGSTFDCAFCVGDGGWNQAFLVSSTDTLGNTVSGVAPINPTTGAIIRTTGTFNGQDGINLNTVSLSRHYFTFNNGLAQLEHNNGSPALLLKGTGSAISLGSLTTGGGTVGLNFYTSGNGNSSGIVDATINASGGSSSGSLNGVLSLNAATVLVNSGIRPGSANTGTIGTSGFPYATAYFQTAPSITSDRRLKAPVSDEEADLPKLARVFRSVRMRAYRLKADPARIHFGIYAQDIADAMTRAGLDWRKYGFVSQDAKTGLFSASYTDIEEARTMLRQRGLLR